MGGTLWASSTLKDQVREHNASQSPKPITARPKLNVYVA